MKSLNRLKYWLWTLLPAAGIFTSAVPPNSATISGMVMDGKKEPLMGVTVVVKHIPTGTFRGAVTRADGRYVFRNLRTGGPYSILLSMTGYRSISKDSIILRDGQSLSMDFRMPRLR